jgi:aspartate/methionine/tyrosine aminotransferase
MVHQNVPFCVPTPLQEAVAVGFEKVLAEEKGYWDWLKDMYTKKRNKLAGILSENGLTPIIPQGSYFILADTSKIPKQVYPVLP